MMRRQQQEENEAGEASSRRVSSLNNSKEKRVFWTVSLLRMSSTTRLTCKGETGNRSDILGSLMH